MKPWWPSCGESPAPIPILVDVGGSADKLPSWYCERIAAFVEFALTQISRSKSTWRTKPLLAVNFVGTGKGGQFERKGEMAEAILAKLSRLVVSHDVDIVLVVADDAAMAAAQAKRPSAAWSDLENALQSKADRLAERARAGELVLFLGAGISQQAGIPTWTELLKKLAACACMSEAEQEALANLPGLDAATVLRSRTSPSDSQFRDSVARLTHSDCFALGHALAAGLPIRESVTTNYDDLFERASYAATGDRPSILPYDPSSVAKRWLLKLHGSVDNPQDIVLTRADYLRYESDRGALYGIVQAMLMTRHILFVGFSLTDDNFHRLADEVRRALEGRKADRPRLQHEQFGSALIPARDELFRSLWADDLDLLTLGERPDFARNVEIVLDYILYKASALTSHLLDNTFAAGLDEQQRRIKEALRKLTNELSAEDRQSATFAPIAKALAELGHRDDATDRASPR
jgi:hypothetical protein